MIFFFFKSFAHLTNRFKSNIWLDIDVGYLSYACSFPHWGPEFKFFKCNWDFFFAHKLWWDRFHHYIVPVQFTVIITSACCFEGYCVYEGTVNELMSKPPLKLLSQISTPGIKKKLHSLTNCKGINIYVALKAMVCICILHENLCCDMREKTVYSVCFASWLSISTQGQELLDFSVNLHSSFNFATLLVWAANIFVFVYLLWLSNIVHSFDMGPFTVSFWGRSSIMKVCFHDVEMHRVESKQRDGNFLSAPHI